MGERIYICHVKYVLKLKPMSAPSIYRFHCSLGRVNAPKTQILHVNGILYILQFTVGQNHSIKPGFVDFLQKCPNIPPLEEWKFVFLIPPGLTLLCPEPKSQLPGLCNLNPYSAELDLRQYLKP